MYKIYFKQAVQMLKQNKFISIITIIGTALAIMMIMVLIVTQSAKDMSTAPEDKRDRTMYMKYQIQQSKKDENNSNMGSLMYDKYKKYIATLKTPELVSIHTQQWDMQMQRVSADAKKGAIQMKVQNVDDTYWKLMTFDFIKGKPFTTEEFNSGIKKAILSESTAQRLFGKEEAFGKTVEINFIPYTVSGIVKDVSPIFRYAYGQIYIPYTSVKGYEHGPYMLLILAKDKNDFKAIADEMRESERRHDAESTEWNLQFNGPHDHRMMQLNHYSNITPDAEELNRNRKRTIFIFAILLLIPAVNLSSFSMSRIKRRTEEIGVRKAFGAKKHTILIQVLYENLITSLIGGFIGLILSYGVVYWLKGWLFNVDSGSSLPIEAFVSFPVFIAVFVICVLLNLISASIPAFRASRMKIVDSINSNNQ